MKTKAKLVDVRGDVEDFSDLIGESGTLYLSKENSYFDTGCGQWLSFSSKRTTKKNNQIRVNTSLGNTFVFDSE